MPNVNADSIAIILHLLIVLRYMAKKN